MPATPRTTRRRSNPPQDGPSSQDSATKLKPNGLYDSNLVQDRIRQWQVHGAADALDPDAISLRSTPLSDYDHDRSRPQSPADPPPRSAPSRRSRWPDRDKENKHETRDASTNSAPRKRLVSDEHWKANKEDRQRHSPRTGLKDTVSTPHYDLSYTSTQRKEEREARRERRKQDRLSRESGRQRSGPIEPDNYTEAPSAVEDLDSYIDKELVRHLGSPSMRDGAESDDSPRQRTRSRYAESGGQTDAPSYSEEPSRTKSKGAAVFFKTKEIFGRYEKPVPLRLPSIEAWLHEQPDPFVDNTPEVETPNVEVPEPLRKHARRPTRRRSTQDPADPDKIWHSVTVRDGGRDDTTPRRDSSWNYGDESPTKSNKPEIDDSGNSPSDLRRSAARTKRSRRQRSSPQQPTNVDDSVAGPRPVIPPSVEPRQRLEKPCPSTGAHHLSAIASVETFDEGRESPSYDILPTIDGPGLKRKLTTHEDLMSVLSLPMNRKSTRSRRPKPQPLQTAAEVLASLVAEEETYLKELRTLVDGVIPVLLQCVLSKSDSVAAAGLFTSSANGKDDLAFTKPIIDMGIALERLKSLHNRIPLQNIDALLGWAHNAQKFYSDYLTAWRLGFQDVVVNLAPLDNGEELNKGMARDTNGDVINADGKKADVAYLLKRPLVRVKNLSKTFEAVKEHSNRQLAQDVTQLYANLTSLARRRHQEEQARLEDEAASRIDSTRARDVQTLGVTTKASVDSTRRVRARDCFNLTMYHTTGQRLDCRVEMILRDNPPTSPAGGDVLICEMDESGKWLLFPPIELHSISARRAEAKFDLVAMVRGPSGISQEWHELLALSSDNPEATTEWMSMLGSNPLPPKLNRTQSFREPEKGPSIVAPSQGPSAGEKLPLPPVSEIDIPLGEPSVIGSPERPDSRGRSNNPFERFMPRLNLGGGLQSKPQSFRPPQGKPVHRKALPSEVSSDRSTISDVSLKELPQLPKASSAPSTPIQRSQARHSRQSPTSYQDGIYMMSGGLQAEEKSPRVSETRIQDGMASRKDQSKTTSRQDNATTENREPRSSPTTPAVTVEQRPELSRKLSATPSTDLPVLSKLRSTSAQQSVPATTPLNESIRDQWNSMSGNGRSKRKSGQKRAAQSQIYTEDIPSPTALSGKRSISPSSTLLPLTPPILVPSTQKESRKSLPARSASPGLDPQPKLTSKEVKARKRRSSSPLKHEYAPSTASDSSAGSDSEDSNDSSSETSEDFMSENQDVAMPLVAVGAGNRRSSKFDQQPLARSSTAPTTGTRTLAPSDSASQAPYRKVPVSSSVPETKKSKSIAMICAWSDKGVWEQIHPDECSVVVSPGLIEAFAITSAHSGARDQWGKPISEDESGASSTTEQPLVAFELTPIVPLRRGTALDINIRSPPTENSKLKTTNNIMFRSRNANECDALYSMINWARCNNPTYIQLQIARPPQPSVTFNIGQPHHSRTRSGSWFSFGGNTKQSSYRASSAPAPGPLSVGGDSEASAGTLNNAFSALRRLGVSSAFNLNRSSVTRKPGLSRASGSLYSSDSGTRTGSSSSTPQPSQLGVVPGRDGPRVPETSAEAADGGGMINNMKIRLYVRKGQHWEHLGAGRLTVMPSEDTTPKAGNSGQSTPTGTVPPLRIQSGSGGAVGLTGARGPRLASSSNTPHRIHGDGREKRIIIRKNKESDEVMLDATLGESCFERVMQTGIAVKIWEDLEQIGDRGGVVMGKEKVYMMQLPGTREAGWVFGLCGTYRYGTDY